jgi:hypothetical protein
VGGIDEQKEDEDGSSTRDEGPKDEDIEDVHGGIVGKSHSFLHANLTCEYINSLIV